MSRGQENQAFNTASGQNSQFNQNAQQSYAKAQQGVGAYENQLAKFAADNPYVQGGEYQTAENQVLANTSDAAAQSAGQALQGAAVRTGGNPNAAIAATEAMQQANERNLSGQEAQAQQQRIGQEAQYNQSVLNASEVPAQLESGLSGQQANAGNAALGEQVKAGETPSFMEELGAGMIQAGANFAGGFGQGMAKGCWVAAELYGGWLDDRTILFRTWLAREYARRWYGRLLIRLYARWGERLAARIRRRDWVGIRLRSICERVFGAGLSRARAWHAAEERVQEARDGQR